MNINQAAWEVVKQKSAQAEAEQRSFDFWYSGLNVKQRNDFEKYCQDHMTPDEYAAAQQAKIIIPKIELKDIEMCLALCNGQINEQEFIEYKQPTNKLQITKTVKFIEGARLVRKWKATIERMKRWN